jgi:hypothetical protein
VPGEAASTDTVAVIYYIGWGCQSLNPPEIPCLNGNFVLDFHEFDLRNVFQVCNPGIKQYLPVLDDSKSVVWIFSVKLTGTFSKSVYKWHANASAVQENVVNMGKGGDVL